MVMTIEPIFGTNRIDQPFLSLYNSRSARSNRAILCPTTFAFGFDMFAPDIRLDMVITPNFESRNSSPPYSAAMLCPSGVGPIVNVPVDVHVVASAGSSPV